MISTQNKSILIGISGASGSGKTLLASTIVNELGSNRVVVLKEDNYYKDQSHLEFKSREEINYDHPDAFDHDLLYKHISDLNLGKDISIPIYDFKTHTRFEDTINIKHHDIIVLEGIMILAIPLIRQLLDIKIFVDTPVDLCLLRRIKRDVIERERNIDSVLEQYQATVRPMFIQFIEPAKKHADIIVPNGGKNRVAIDLIKTKINSLLKDPIDA